MNNDTFSLFVLDQLMGLPGIESRRMFGGYGLYQGDTFFGLISSEERLYFKTNGDSREDYAARGMGPFRPNERMTLKTYYEVPPDVLEDPETLQTWARRAIDVQRKEGDKSNRRSKAGRRRRSPP